MKHLWIFAASTCFFSLPALAEDKFDFVLIGRDCKMMASFHVLSDDSLQTVKSDTPIMYCSKALEQVTCILTYAEDSEKLEQRNYLKITDSPPLLFFRSIDGAELAYVDTAKMAGTYSSAKIGDNYLAQRLCSMTFITHDQYVANSSKGG